MSNDKNTPRKPKKPGDYETGWGKPPEKNRFKKGAPSPNPKGRPRKKSAKDDGSIETSAALREALDRKIRITEGGKIREITARRAITKKIVNKMLTTDDEIALIRFAIFLERMERADLEGESREPLHIILVEDFPIQRMLDQI